MKNKELTALEYFINYFTPKPSEDQIEEFKRLVKAQEQGKTLFYTKKRRLW
jgi:hypothetical protein